ncbi:hypothetical protein KBI23_01360 [bacterium]|nr:hypothetical protein [bacterium]MBP9807079.1 hypothetical protein [bacterium]
MKKTLLKRHSGLRPFARDHGVGLICVYRLRKSVRGSKADRLKLVAQMRAVCSELISLSLFDEQRVLAPFLARTGYAHRFYRHHHRIRDLMECLNRLEPSEDPGLGILSMLSNALDEYVRWEENVLFPAIERQLSYEESAWLARITEQIELTRCRPTQRLHASVEGAECMYTLGLKEPSSRLEAQFLGSMESTQETRVAVAI